MSGCVIDFCISDRRTSTCGKFVQLLRKCSNPTLHDHYRGIFSEDAADRSFQRHQDVSVYIFKDAGDPNDRSICDPAVSFRSCSLGDHGINVWNAKWKHGSDDAIDYGLDSSICSRGIVLTTLLSIITLPIVAYLI